MLTSTGVEIEQATPDPLREADRWKIFDAINANAWAFRWAGYATDDVACRWTDWLLTELRLPGPVDHFKLFYLTCSWRIAFAMRAGRTFDAEVLALMKDEEWIRKTKDQIKVKASAHATTSKASVPTAPPPPGDSRRLPESREPRERQEERPSVTH